MPTRKKQPDPIPDSFQTLEEAAGFWDTHSTVDYDDAMREVHFDVDLQRRTLLVPRQPGKRDDHRGTTRRSGTRNVGQRVVAGEGKRTRREMTTPTEKPTR